MFSSAANRRLGCIFTPVVSGNICASTAEGVFSLNSGHITQPGLRTQSLPRIVQGISLKQIQPKSFPHNLLIFPPQLRLSPYCLRTGFAGMQLASLHLICLHR